MKKFLIKTLENKYPVFVGDFNIRKIVELISRTSNCDYFFILIDKKVNGLYGKLILKEFRKQKKIFYSIVINASEKQKSFPTIHKIYNELSKHYFGRDVCLVAIGGGIIGDLGGFVASTYMRGIKCVHVPTTILGAVDSSIGGKTGYNFKYTKNLIGSFYQPVSIITSTRFFNSLPVKEVDSGIGEVIKYTYLSGKYFFEYVLSNYSLLSSLDGKVVNRVLNECISIKSSIVTLDEKEKSLRKILNFGHTFAHAFETYFNFRISHGKAVTAGIIAANILSYKLGMFSKNKLNQFQKLPEKVSLPKFLTGFKNSEIIKIMKLDKKNRSGRLNFVLLKDFGELIVDVNAGKSELNWTLNEFKKTISV